MFVLRGWKPSKGFLLSTFAIVVGVFAALGASILMVLARWVGFYVQRGFGLFGWPGLLLMMGGVGFLIGLGVQKWGVELKGSGIPYVMEAMATRSGRIPLRIVPLKTIATALTIGVGGSVGREGPIVQIGATLGSFVGQLFHVSTKRVRILAACGAAAGISAAFNTPIAGTIFALEVILTTFTTRYFGTVVLSSVSASIVSRAIWGAEPAFRVPPYPLSHVGEIPIYIVLALLAAVVAVYWTKALALAEGAFFRKSVWQPFWLALGLMSTGFFSWLFQRPEILGSGLEHIGDLITKNVHLSIGLLLGLFVLKLVATAATTGTGNSGGFFAPSLFLGATLGAVLGALAHHLWPHIAPNAGAYAIAGMAGVFAASTRAPMTAVLMVFELSNDYHLIVPLLLVTALSTFVAEFLYHESIYTWQLSKRGVVLQGGRDLNILEGVAVQDIMVAEVHATSEDTTLAELSELMARTHWNGVMVLNNKNRLAGIVTITDLDSAIHRKLSPDTRVLEIATPFHRIQTVTSDDSMNDALLKMGERGFNLLPVVSSDDESLLVGMIERKDVICSYNKELARRADVRHRTQRHRLTLEGTEFVDVELSLDDHVVGMKVCDVARLLPYDSILVSIRREGKVLIPHGSTVLRVNDLVTAFVRTEDVEILLECFRRLHTGKSS